MIWYILLGLDESLFCAYVLDFDAVKGARRRDLQDVVSLQGQVHDLLRHLEFLYPVDLVARQLEQTDLFGACAEK